MAWPTKDADSIQHATVLSPESDNLAPQEIHGRLRLAYFSFAITNESSGFVWSVARLPPNIRLLAGEALVDAVTGADLNVGISRLNGSTVIPGRGANVLVSSGLGVLTGEVDSLGSVKSAAAAALLPFNDGITDFYGNVIEVPTVLSMTLTANATAPAVVTGFLRYVVD